MLATTACIGTVGSSRSSTADRAEEGDIAWMTWSRRTMSHWPLGCSPSGTRVAAPPRARSSGGSGVTAVLMAVGSIASSARRWAWRPPSAPARPIGSLTSKGNCGDSARHRTVSSSRSGRRSSTTLDKRRSAQFECGTTPRRPCEPRPSHYPSSRRGTASRWPFCNRRAQAGLLNLEGALEERFGSDFTLGSALSVPLQLTGFRDTRTEAPCAPIRWRYADEDGMLPSSVLLASLEDVPTGGVLSGSFLQGDDRSGWGLVAEHNQSIGTWAPTLRGLPPQSGVHPRESG